ncbi:hemolysin III family protein [Acholeplasma equirhinis]|uniref:PAQR family membrane homeostasis protein TrhA n=1 Tax=Acholeplasma equirhinis TaxID=555393 RepID=UPI00197A71B7|nr:hemolysin III family protein [Acholeplasma equirhinis]MBN3490229.1 hemolysin III family protein [Acholeplasma equirhinis]
MQEKKIKRPQTVGEEIANATSHGIMAIFGIYALVALILKSDNAWELTSAIVFGISIIMLYLMSTLYHSLAFTKSKSLFKRFDHISIYILIGGTFAPALLLLPSLRSTPFLGIPGMLDIGLTLFIGQWILIIVGIVFKSIWVYKYQPVHIGVYLLLGWSAIYFILDLYLYAPNAMWLILLGGICYSIGVVFYALSRIKYFHFVWHIMVAAGTILQFLAIYLYLM